jgi:exodeoxyribonuclease VII large subunit
MGKLMGKQAKSQWDFGELFPAQAAEPAPSAPDTRTVLTVAELTTQVKRLLEKQVGQVWVTGEVTNFRSQSSGHLYFTLKDAESQLSCVLFRNEARAGRALLEDGRKVLLQGQLTVYEPRGQYQLRVTAVELQGVGALQAAFEKLKQKLNAEGLFATERKRPLPRYPQRIGIVTSPTGAAIRDVLHVVQRRNPALQIVLAPARVQGQGAAEEIAAAIRLLNEFTARESKRGNGLDLILLTRGGGSLEDLWAFNEETVARAIFESALPVVSAVGHEIDFTISDFVADLRAATPSAAAEIITEGVFSSAGFLAEAGPRLGELLRRQLEEKETVAAWLTGRLARMHPHRRLNEWLQRLDDLQEGLSRLARQAARERRVAWGNLRERLRRVRPGLLVAQRRELLTQQAARLREQAGLQLEGKQTRLAALEGRLRLLGPEQVLARGYSITMNADTGKVIRTATEVKAGQRLRTRLKWGEVRSVARD